MSNFYIFLLNVAKDGVAMYIIYNISIYSLIHVTCYIHELRITITFYVYYNVCTHTMKY